MSQVRMQGEQFRTSAFVGESAFFDGSKGTASRGRKFASTFLERAQTVHGVPVTAETVEVARLVVSELLTNAAAYAPGPCLLELEVSGEDLKVTVWDTETTAPVPRPHDAERVGQHGLEIVLNLCRGFEIERQAGGKRVTARIALT